MSLECCDSGGSIMILSCSGGSNVGQLANQTAVELTREGFGKMYCLAGVGGGLPGFVRSARDVEELIVIDGCEMACGRALLLEADVPIKNYVIVTLLGIEKNYDFNLKSADLDKVKGAAKKACGGHQTLSPGSRRGKEGDAPCSG